ncbi:hypothetical protein BK702_00095 [Bacillus thuringiensis serovar cameroun]|nr:hypothetical protein BK702_00095 [Bacillus thuringiensis serovar cameroun]
MHSFLGIYAFCNTLNKIKAICTMKKIKNYELIDEMLDYYINNKLNSNEKNTLNDMLSIRGQRVLQN